VEGGEVAGCGQRSLEELHGSPLLPYRRQQKIIIIIIIIIIIVVVVVVVVVVVIIITIKLMNKLTTRLNCTIFTLHIKNMLQILLEN
jgi:heme/copper-type cytochrome/quinol oxidase subunit 2